MNCKHLTIKDNSIYCKALKKNINGSKCKDCVLKLPDNSKMPEEFRSVFGDIFNY